MNRPAATRPTPSTAPSKATAAKAVAAVRPGWVPIRSLGPEHRAKILQHLLALPERDRYLRFGCTASDGHIERYVAGLNFDRDEIFGVFNRRLRLVAMAHVAYAPQGVAKATPGTAEFGGSVLPHLRGRGLGTHLFAHAMLHARNRGIGHFFIHALSENAAMLNIARHAGATVHRDGPESQATLRLPRDTIASQVEQAVIEGAAAIDYQFKQQARLVSAVVDAIGEVRDAVRSSEQSSAQ